MRHRNVKILATLGPASNSKEMIHALHEAGADAFRLNMSHLDIPGLKQQHALIREVEEETGRPISILVDLQGPKLRVGKFENDGIDLTPGATLRFDMSDELGSQERAQLHHPEIIKAVKVGHTLLLDDGRLSVEVTEAGPDYLITKVLLGGRLTNRKGVNVPQAVLPVSAMSDKDRGHAETALELGIDWLAMSFIQRPEDVAEGKKLAAGRAGIMAKIEKPQAFDNIEEILELSDALMVARGDLGVELPVEQVPGRQKQLIRLARSQGKPVVVATQMLESMISSPMPTRAEVSDVATAVFEGADAIMLSAESAAGDYPIEAVQMMDRVARQAEDDPTYPGIIYAQHAEPEATGADAIAGAARTVSETLNAAAIICWTNSGSTGLRVARERPQVPILALTPIVETARRMTLVWGLHCVFTKDAQDLDDMVDRACRICFRENIARAGQRVIITAGVPLGTPGATNMLRIAFVGGRDATTL